MAGYISGRRAAGEHQPRSRPAGMRLARHPPAREIPRAAHRSPWRLSGNYYTFLRGSGP